jgi:hypothetical protein
MLEIKTLADWAKILKELDFHSESCQFLDQELTGIDWHHDNEHIVLYTNYTKDYYEFLKNLPENTEFTPDWNKCEVRSIELYTKEFGYPEGKVDFSDNWIGNILLSCDDPYENFKSLTVENFHKALLMIRNPITTKNEIIKGFISEMDIFLNKHSEILKKLGFKEKSSSILNVGSETHETEPWIEYINDNGYNNLIISYNIFTDILYYTKYIKSNNDYLCYQVNVNDLTCEEFEKELTEYLNN